MSRIKEILEVKGVSQTGLANKLGKKLLICLIYIQQIKFNHL